MAGKNVLIVDDSKTYRLLLGSVLRHLNCKIVGEAEDGEQAVALYQPPFPDLVLLDIEMPRMNGIQTLKALLALNARAKIIMCTSVGHQDVVEDCLLAGAVDYIRKDKMDEIPARLEPYLEEGGLSAVTPTSAHHD